MDITTNNTEDDLNEEYEIEYLSEEVLRKIEVELVDFSISGEI